MLTCLGKFLRTFRIQRGELLKDMADKLSLAPAYLSSIENGKRLPTKSFIQNIIGQYDLDEKMKRDLMDAYRMSLDEISFSTKTATEDQKMMGIAFARKFDHLSENQIQEIQKILTEVKD